MPPAFEAYGNECGSAVGRSMEGSGAPRTCEEARNSDKGIVRGQRSGEMTGSAQGAALSSTGVADFRMSRTRSEGDGPEYGSENPTGGEEGALPEKNRFEGRMGGDNMVRRTRSTPLGEIDLKRIDPLALSKADRRWADDSKYYRPDFTAEQFEELKQKWQARQVKRVSNAARLYGARVSQKSLWDFLEAQRAATQGKPATSLSKGVGESMFPLQSFGKGYSYDQTMPDDSSNHDTAVHKEVRDVCTERNAKVSVKKSISRMLKGMWGGQEKPSNLQVLMDRVKSKDKFAPTETI